MTGADMPDIGWREDEAPRRRFPVPVPGPCPRGDFPAHSDRAGHVLTRQEALDIARANLAAWITEHGARP